MESVEGRTTDEDAKSERGSLTADAFALGSQLVERASQAMSPAQRVHAVLVACPRHLHSDVRAGHPGWRRCSSIKYSRYSQSSRLAIRAPRSEIRCTTDADGPLFSDPRERHPAGGDDDPVGRDRAIDFEQRTKLSDNAG
jgi:hypothetical protein